MSKEDQVVLSEEEEADRIEDALFGILHKIGKEELTAEEHVLLDGLRPIEQRKEKGLSPKEKEGLVKQIQDGDDEERAAALAVIDGLISQQQVGFEDPSDDGEKPPVPPVAWLLKTQQGDPWMPDHTVTLFTGKGGVGKSRLALQLGVHVARGGGGGLGLFGSGNEKSPALWTNRDEGGVEIPRSGKVVYACWETRRSAFWHRAEAVSSQEGDKGKSKIPPISYVNMKPLGALWGVKQGQHVAQAGGWLPAADWLLEGVAERNADLLILDPQAAAYMQNENDRGLVRSFLASLDAWCEEHQCAVLLIAHPPKAGGHQYAGSTDWHNGVQCLWTLDYAKDEKDKPKERDGEPVLQLSVEKMNEAKRPQAIELVYDGGRYVEYTGGNDEY